MFTLLKRFNIIQISIISFSLFVLLVVVLAGFSIQVTSSRYFAAQQDIETLNLTAALEQVAHHHAVERGLTAGYLGAPSSSKKQALDAQRKKADASEKRLETLLSIEWPADFRVTQYVLPLKKSLAGKGAMRRKVDSQSAYQAFDFYSTLNRLALDMGASITSKISEKEVLSAAKTILLYAQYKERSGQVRGMVNGALARKSIDGQFQAKLKSFTDDIVLVSTYLDNALPSDMQGVFLRIIEGNTNQQIKRVSQTLTTSLSPDFNALPNSSEWFANATKHIGDIKQLLDSQVKTAQASADQAAATAFSMLLMFLISVAVVLSVILLLNIYLVKNLRFELRELTNALRKVAEDGDLTMDVRLDSKNELGFISNAIHRTIYAFKDLITGLAESIKANRQLNTQMQHRFSDVESSVQSTELLATNIASSITEMSSTCDDIARSASQTLDSCGELQQSVKISSESNQQTRAAMQTLSSEMHAVESHANNMETQLKAISGILETINNVAEQTNLLALNAAIEAARAGEQGRGFAVVADEVRSLAQGSKQSSDQISKMLGDLDNVSSEMITSIRSNVSKATNTYDVASQAETYAQQLFTQAQEVESMTTSVSTAAEEQSVVAKQIAENAVSVLESAQTEVETVSRCECCPRI